MAVARQRRSTRLLVGVAGALFLVSMRPSFGTEADIELPWLAAGHFEAKPSRHRLTGTSLGKPATRSLQMSRQFFQGSVLDPDYWKRQWFLSGDLRAQMPKNVEKLCVLEFLPTDNKHLAYIIPEGEKRINRYIALWEGTKQLKKDLLDQSGVFSESDPLFVDWIAGRQSDLEKEVADVVIVPAGSFTRLGGDLARGLQEIWRVLKPEGRALIVMDNSESNVLGDLDDVLDGVMSSQQQDNLLSITGLDLRRIVRDEDNSGLTLAVCFKNEKAVLAAARRAAGAAKKQRKAKANTGTRSSAPGRGGPAKRRR